MPQMSPSWWIMMLIFSTLIMMQIMSITFHNKENKMIKMKKKYMTINWKW